MNDTRHLAPLVGRFWCNEHGSIFVVEDNEVRPATPDEADHAQQLWLQRSRRHRFKIGDTVYEFPEGTTREEAEAVLEEGKQLYLRMLLIGQLRQLAEKLR